MAGKTAGAQHTCSSFLFWDEGLNSRALSFVFAKQALYHLSHTSSPFCSGYFEDGGLTNYLPRLASNHDPPD
jgi:hypothetical protein